MFIIVENREEIPHHAIDSNLSRVKKKYSLAAFSQHKECRKDTKIKEPEKKHKI